MASAASGQTVTSSNTAPIFDSVNDGGKCTSFVVGVRSTSAFGCLVRVPGLHEDGAFIGLPVGTSLEFRLNHLGIARVYAKGDGGDSLLDFGVTSKTYAH